VAVVTIRKPPQNVINLACAAELIYALQAIANSFRQSSSEGGAVVVTSFSSKFWSAGLDIDEHHDDPDSHAKGFYPLVAELLSYPFATVAMITGHTFGGASLIALACDYRVMNSRRGYFSLPSVKMGVHFPGIGILPRMKLQPQIARKMLMEGFRWTSGQAFEDGIVDEMAEPDIMLARAITIAEEHAPYSGTGVYALLRSELYGKAFDAFQEISSVSRTKTDEPVKAKI
jgi:enoyl-CoA hydratase/carnithine racemase